MMFLNNAPSFTSIALSHRNEITIDIAGYIVVNHPNLIIYFRWTVSLTALRRKGHCHGHIPTFNSVNLTWRRQCCGSQGDLFAQNAEAFFERQPLLVSAQSRLSD